MEDTLLQPPQTTLSPPKVKGINQMNAINSNNVLNGVKVPGSKIHIFENAGLGKGPFKFCHVTSEGGNCQFCGTGIVFRFYLSGVDGSSFFVGSDCVMKTGDAGLMKIVDKEVKKHQKALRDKRDVEKILAIKNKLLEPAVIAEYTAKLHPSAYYARQGRTMLEYMNWIVKNAGNSTVIKLGKILFPKPMKNTSSCI